MVNRLDDEMTKIAEHMVDVFTANKKGFYRMSLIESNVENNEIVAVSGWLDIHIYHFKDQTLTHVYTFDQIHDGKK